MSRPIARGEGGVAVSAGGGVELTGSIGTKFCPNVFLICRWVDIMGMVQAARAYAPARVSSTGIHFL